MKSDRQYRNNFYFIIDSQIKMLHWNQLKEPNH
jgi:hypothetical protein